jgi:hypothetical protein
VKLQQQVKIGELSSEGTCGTRGLAKQYPEGIMQVLNQCLAGIVQVRLGYHGSSVWVWH